LRRTAELSLLVAPPLLPQLLVVLVQVWQLVLALTLAIQQRREA
jgi:hypothetical protein